jgi:hypothetical protein
MSWALQWLPSRLATHCGSPLLYDSQWVKEGWSDPPRPVTVAEWLNLMSAWHRLLHSGNPAIGQSDPEKEEQMATISGMDCSFGLRAPARRMASMAAQRTFEVE